jgi:hypothetical protein
MIYIITFATHEERYFPLLKKSCPGLIILGEGMKWTGSYDKVKAMTDFCRTKNDDDVMCFVNGFDCICLGNDCKNELLRKFIAMNCELVFSKTSNPANILDKFIFDKLYGSCNKDRLNSGMYIGYSKPLIAYWEDMKPEDDDQYFATKKCIKDPAKIKIDSHNELFYRYSVIDHVDIKNEKISILDSMPCVIQAPRMSDIKDIISKLGYKHIPDVTFNIFPKIKKYYKNFLLEIVFLFFIIFLFRFVSNKIMAGFIALIIFLEMTHYELYVKHLDRSKLSKFMFMILDTLHGLFISFLIFSIYFTFKNFNCNLKNLFYVNLLFGLFILSFVVFKMCVLTIIENKILGVDVSNRTFSHFKRLSYFIDINLKYDIQNGSNAYYWIKGNIPILVSVFFLNLYSIRCCF